MEQMLKSHYLIREQIGRGAFGRIYHALDEKNNREVAIKVWKTGSETEIFSHKNSPFMREEQIPGIVKIYDYFEKAGMNFLVMEYLTGGTLKQKQDMIRKQNSPEKILKLFEPVLEGLAFLHSEGLVHCDLSLDNLMFDRLGNLKLIDLGACQGKEIVCDKKFMKEAYSAPEQYTDTDRIGPWTDIYGICAVLFETLTGERTPSSAQRIQKDEIHSVSFYQKIDRHMEQAILRGLSLEIQQRYFSMELLLHGMGADTEKIKVLSGSTRYFWGQKWIKISGQGIGYHKEGKKRSRRIVRQIGVGIFVIGLAAGMYILGDSWMQNHYPLQYFEYKAKKAKEHGIARNDEELISSLDKNYGEILKKLTEYAPEMGEDLEQGSVSCELTEAELMKCNIPWNSGRKMYLDKDSVKKVLFSELDLNQEKIQIKEDKDYNSAVYRSVDGDYEYLKNMTISKESFQVEIPGKETEYYTISYDPTDRRVICLNGSTTDPERFRIFTETMFPVCCPEAYLTSEEIADLQTQMEKSEESNVIQVNFHSWISFFSQIDSDKETVRYYVKIAASNAGLCY